MKANQPLNHDPLDGAIQAFQRMNVPARPPDAEVLARLGDRSAQRKLRRAVVVASAVAGLLLLVGLVLFSRFESSSPEATHPRSEGPLDTEAPVSLAVDSLESRVKASPVIVVATAESSVRVPPSLPGDAPEFLIRFTVKRILKGKMVGNGVTVRTATPPDKIIGQDWVVCLSPDHIAGKHQYAALTAAEFEPRFKEILAPGKK